MKKTIKVTDIKITDDSVSFVILVMQGSILLSKSPEFYVKFDRKVKVYNSTVISAFNSIFYSRINNNARQNYNLVVDLKADFDIENERKKYVNYMLIDSLGLDSNAVNMILNGTIDYTTLNLENYKANAQANLSIQHQPAIKAQIRLPQNIDNAVRFNIDHNNNFQITSLFLVDDLKAHMMFNGSVDEYKTNKYKLGTGFDICTSNFINGSIASMIMNLALDTDNFWNRFLDCGGTRPPFKDFKKLMMAIYADKYLKLGYMTPERIMQYIDHRKISLTAYETLSMNYEREFMKKTTRTPSDVIVPLLNIEKEYIAQFFDKQEDKIQLDQVYAFLADPRFEETVNSCRGDFKLFLRDNLAKALSDDKASLDAISQKLDAIDHQIEEIVNGQH